LETLAWTEATLDGLTVHLRPALVVFCRLFWLFVAAACFKVSGAGNPLGASFCLIALTVSVLLYPAFLTGGAGIPFLGFYLLQQALIYSMPLFLGNATVVGVPETSVWECSLLLVLHLASALAGWLAAGIFSWKGSPSRFGIPEISTPEKLLPITLGCLVLNLIFETSVMNGSYWDYFGFLGFGSFSVVRAIMGAVVVVAAFAGGFAIASGPRYTLNGFFYWALIVMSLLVSFSGILLSAGLSVCIAVCLGYVLGAKRLPLVFMVLVGCFAFLLSEGKYSMRNKYWVDGNSSQHHVDIAQMPDFYMEWMQESMRNMGNDESFAEGDEGDLSMLERIDNMQNLLYINAILRETNIPTLNGETYTIIPALLIPRIFWPDKPRTHEGQIKLNVHFGRQTEEQTVNTNISWGLLPEAIGNFGLVWGPVISGLFLGGILRLLQKYSCGKRLFSLEGMICCLLLMSTVASFEMVASVLVTSVFQMLISAILGYMALKVFAEGEAKTAPRRMQRPSP
jgi:hypothetical protein